MSLAPSLNLSAFTDAMTSNQVEVITDPFQVTKLSQDFHTFSPILTTKLAGKIADVVVRPASIEQVLTVAKACVQQRVPVTVRGAGTGNYGQCVPLHGGVVIDMTKMQDICWVKPGIARAQAGIKLAALDQVTKETGWELRMAPSTYRTATLGGFIAGGSGGIGSVEYGLLRDRGNLLGLQVVTLEDEPRVIELRGDDVQKVNHAWGINGIITEVEIPLAPAYPWVEVIVTFPAFMTALRFGQALANADGMVKKEIGIFAAPIPEYFIALRSYFTQGEHAALLIVAESSLEFLDGLVKAYQGKITYQQVTGKQAIASQTNPKTSNPKTSKNLNLGEYTWNHTTLHARSADSSITYLQCVFPNDNLQTIEHMYNHFGDEVMMHLEFIRVNGNSANPALQLVRYTNPERLTEIIQYHEQHGVFVANPHSYLIEEGWKRSMEPEHIEFKKLVDPYNLMNPGKSKFAV